MEKVTRVFNIAVLSVIGGMGALSVACVFSATAREIFAHIVLSVITLTAV